MRTIQVKINGDIWKARRLSSKEFLEFHGDDDIAMTIYDHKKPFREIHFSPKGLQISTIRHEVYHAYFSYLNLTGLTRLEIEECNADLIGSKLKYIEKVSKRIYKALS